MAENFSFEGFDVTKRVDNLYNVWDYGWYPDAELDADPELNAQWLARTQGWRAKGWQVVAVLPTLAAAKSWCHAHA